MALNLAPFGRWTLRDNAAQRRLAAAGNSTVQHSRRNFKTTAEAKLAAFDHITRLLSHVA
jgi:hypothetical protein